MRFYGIDFAAHELGVHPSSLRRWEENGLIAPERATMGKTTLRIYDEATMRVLRRVKGLMDEGMTVHTPLAALMMKSSRRNSTMIDMEVIRRLNSYDTDALIAVLELNEDRIYQWLVLGSPTVVREDLDKSVEYLKALRETVRSELPDYVSPYETMLPF